MRQRVLIVDDVAENRQLLVDYLEGVDCTTVTAASGAEALEIMRTAPADLVLLDVEMPGMSGLEVCRHIKGDRSARLVPVVFVTAYGALEDRVAALEAGGDDFLAKPVEQTELVARVRSLLRVSHLFESLLHAEHVVLVLAKAVEARDPFTQAHSDRVADLASRLAEAAGLDQDSIDAISFAARVHDIGKISVPDAILAKREALDPAEAEVMRGVPAAGAEICGSLCWPPGLAEMIRHQKERFDGGGYPDGIRGAEISIGARILAICDAYDSLLCGEREPKQGMSAEKARAILEHQAGRAFDAELVKVFLRLPDPTRAEAAAGS